MDRYDEDLMLTDVRIIYNATIEYLIKNIFHPVLLSINDQLILHQNSKNYQNDCTTNSNFVPPFFLFKNKMRIFIRSIDGELFSLVVRNNDFVKNIKNEICNKIGLIAEEHILCFQGEILNDMMTMIDYGIINNSLINIFGRLRGGMQIFARALDGKTVTFEVRGTSTIMEVKYKIQEKLGLHPEEQRLVFAGAVLEDEKTLDDYQVTDKSVLNVVTRLRGGMQLFAKTMDGKTVAFEVQKSEKVIDIKKKIQEKIGLQPDEQKLVYQGAILEDDKTIDECQIAEKSVINVVARLRGGMQIFAKTMDGKTVAFEVQRSEKIIDVKKKIQEKIGLHPDEQKLVYQGGILDDDKSIDEYQITEKSVINVVARLRGGMQLFAKTLDGKTVTFEVQKSEKVIDIKKKIQEKMGLHPDEQKLVYQGAMLEDDKTIDECQIAEKSVINVVARLRGGMQIFAKTMDGKTVTFEVERSEKLIDIRKKIHQKLALPIDEQKLIYQGVILEGDNKTIDECQITDKSIINIVARLRGGFVASIKSGDKQMILFHIKILENLQDKSGLHRNGQILFYQMNDDSKSVNQYGIIEISATNGFHENKILVPLKKCSNQYIFEGHRRN